MPWASHDDAVVRRHAGPVSGRGSRELSAAFRESPMKRAKLAELRRNAEVVLTNAEA